MGPGSRILLELGAVHVSPTAVDQQRIRGDRLRHCSGEGDAHIRTLVILSMFLDAPVLGGEHFGQKPTMWSVVQNPSTLGGKTFGGLPVVSGSAVLLWVSCDSLT